MLKLGRGWRRRTFVGARSARPAARRPGRPLSMRAAGPRPGTGFLFLVGFGGAWWPSLLSVARRCAAASMACYGPLLTPRAAVSQRFEENYEITDQCAFLPRSRCSSALWGLNRARAPADRFGRVLQSAKSDLPKRGVQRAPTRAEASPPLVSMLPPAHLNRPPQPTAAAQNETHDWYLDAGRRFCNQSQRYHRYAVKPAG